MAAEQPSQVPNPEMQEGEEKAMAINLTLTGEDASLVSSIRFMLHQNFWFSPEFLKSIQLVKQQFMPRPDDIILATFPKCGTTWPKALAFAITSRSGHSLAHHPCLPVTLSMLCLSLSSLTGRFTPSLSLKPFPHQGYSPPTFLCHYNPRL